MRLSISDYRCLFYILLENVQKHTPIFGWNENSLIYTSLILNEYNDKNLFTETIQLNTTHVVYGCHTIKIAICFDARYWPIMLWLRVFELLWYCVVFFVNRSTNKIEKVHKNALRLTLNDFTPSYSVMLEVVKRPTLYISRIENTANDFFLLFFFFFFLGGGGLKD